MPTISSSISKDYLDMYSGYNHQSVGLGMIEPNAYASKAYQKTKIKSMLIGGISRIIYAGMEHDREPLVLAMKYIPQYNVVLGYNLHYCPQKLRQAILKYVLDSNVARIKSNQPIIVDYNALKRAIPDSQYIVRMYKVVGINVLETIPLMEWPEVVKDKTKWSNHYQMIKEGRVK